MCGLVGMAGFLDHDLKNAMKDLLFLDSLRGRDSTGLTAVNREREVLTRKFTVPGYEFIEYPVVDKAMTYGDQLWLGHNRFRTFGAINKANAHPFEVLDDEGNVLLVGAHNGSLDNKFEIESRLGGDKFETDSETLFNWFCTANNYKEAIGLLRGAWSLVWWDATANTLHLCRNDQRPMSFAYTKDRKAIVWASEPWMIINACRRNKVDLETNDKGHSCFATLPDYLYTIEIPQERNAALPELHREGGYKGAPPRGRYSYTGGYGHDQWWDYEHEKVEEEAKQAAEKTAANGKKDEPSPSNVVHIGTPPVRGYNGENLSRKELAALMDKGCGWCGDKFGTNDRYAFLEEGVLCCHKCVYDTHPDGDRVRQEEDDPFDDDLPFNLQYPDDDERPEGQFEQKNSPEFRKLINAAIGSAKKALG